MPAKTVNGKHAYIITAKRYYDDEAIMELKVDPDGGGMLVDMENTVKLFDNCKAMLERSTSRGYALERPLAAHSKFRKAILMYDPTSTGTVVHVTVKHEAGYTISDFDMDANGVRDLMKDLTPLIIDGKIQEFERRKEDERLTLEILSKY